MNDSALVRRVESGIVMRTTVVRSDLQSRVGAIQWLVRDLETDQHYLVSGINAPFTGWEVLVFRADEKGTVTDWGEVAGGKGLTHEDAILDLEERLEAGTIDDDDRHMEDD